MDLKNHPLNKYLPVSFFVIGFVFDLVTTDRIDQSFSLVQQLVYLAGLMLLIFWEVRPPAAFLNEQSRWFKIAGYRIEALHFLFGSLLSLYTIFYFRSASLVTSFVFMMVLVGLLLVNEWPGLRQQQLKVRSALFALCLSSYFIYLVPVVTGSLGLFTFLLAMVISSSLYYLLSMQIQKVKSERSWIRDQILVPGLTIQALLIVLYFARVLPPVPVSLKFIGIYHQVVKKDGEYHLYYDRPRWKFWQSGAQTFLAQPGDQVNCFVSVFSPTAFRDDVVIQWWFYSKPDKRWLLQDSIPLKVHGGRDQGFRGSVSKSNFQEGEWSVRVLSSDSREIGRISLDIEKIESQGERTWRQDTF